MIELHENLQRKLDADRFVPNHLKPGVWNPHVSLISPYAVVDHEFILRRIEREFAPISGTAVGLFVDHHETKDTYGEYGGDVRECYFGE